MNKNWTFGQKLATGFAVIVLLALVTGAMCIRALQTVVASKEQVLTVTAANLTNAQALAVAAARKSSAIRGYLLAKDERHVEEAARYTKEVSAMIARMRQSNADPAALRLLRDIEEKASAHEQSCLGVIAMRRTHAPQEQVIKTFDDQLLPRFESLVQALDVFMLFSRRSLESESRAMDQRADDAVEATVALCIAVALLAIAIAVLLARALNRQVGTAVAQVQSSSSELQLAANQQATSAKEQATAMTEITTTITELLATSRQIAESARRVAHIAEQTATTARSGDASVDKAQESVAAIRRQVELIVTHMVELGKKSQQIGAVLDIVSELAEQTNILAINATIEAAGAGEAGKRFAVVADEIRKLADRVTGSTKEVRGLIEDVRSSVNTTIMTTETGSKAVEAGSRQVLEFTSAFKQIAGGVGTTTEAAREIELSTKQQATAVEQVNIAVTNVAQATRETEATSTQTLQTASQLSSLSAELMRLVQSGQNSGAARHSRALQN